jgi:hypothetical protein
VPFHRLIYSGIAEQPRLKQPSTIRVVPEGKPQAASGFYSFSAPHVWRPYPGKLVSALRDNYLFRNKHTQARVTAEMSETRIKIINPELGHTEYADYILFSI